MSRFFRLYYEDLFYDNESDNKSEVRSLRGFTLRCFVLVSRKKNHKKKIISLE